LRAFDDKLAHVWVVMTFDSESNKTVKLVGFVEVRDKRAASRFLAVLFQFLPYLPPLRVGRRVEKYLLNSSTFFLRQPHLLKLTLREGASAERRHYRHQPQQRLQGELGAAHG
jgi:hypothetical protein